ncbi:hypothetical protein J2S13_001765 [Oikeobacillus pervagus]|uniref:Uncharacterized protein n=1 Tax=Oikeobacillus pervagus TaxID=1325931 RepID=A0AAJ1T1A2_9BACI|nr:hypothetical protein [Oikeobacillus pervagus]MDQ0215352.1 hypothetical protein [Oikeobacillus pervagus]
MRIENKKWLFVFLLMVVISSVMILWIQPSKQPKEILRDFEQAVKQEDSEILKKWVIVDDHQAEINEASLNAMITYLKENKSSYEAIKESLEDQVNEKEFTPTNQQISLIEDGKMAGIWPKYKLFVKTASIKVIGQEVDDKISLSFHNTGKSMKKKDGYLFGAVLPGTYQLDLRMQNKLGVFLEKKKVDIWSGSKQVSLIMDPHKLIQKDKSVREKIISAIHVFNQDLAAYYSSGFNQRHLTNLTEELKKDSLLPKESLEIVNKHVDEFQLQYLSAIVNIEDVDIQKLQKGWTAETKAFVSYKNRLKIRGDELYEHTTFKKMRTFTLIYDEKRKQWLVDDVFEVDSNGFEVDSWKKPVKLKGENLPASKWKPNGVGETL